MTPSKRIQEQKADRLQFRLLNHRGFVMDSIFFLRFGIGALFVALFSISTLSGCAMFSAAPEAATEEAPTPTPMPAQVPAPTLFPESGQPRLLAGQHWQAIARDAARALSNSLTRGQRCGAGIKPCQTLFVAPPQYVTEFSRAFVNALLTALVQQGLQVSQAEEGALALHVDVQGVRFHEGANNESWMKSLAPELWTPTEKGAKDGRAMTLPGERSEIIVTLSVLEGKRYAARSSTVYYVGNADLPLYEQEICSLSRPCQGNAPLPARTAPLPLVGDPA
ncbi:MAG: hypothetical protein LBF93_10040 [Zoogloeaceae bacterium]|jgi:hypothetical protein|nr:hypothetical protein [Zoogloeaceae bacterium]